MQSDDARVSQSGAWTLTVDAAADGGSYLVNTAATDVLTIEFTGPYFEVIFLRGAGYGTFAIEIDNSVVRTVVATEGTASYDQRSVIDYLSDAPHTARIYPVSGAIAIDAFVTVPRWHIVFESNFDDRVELKWADADQVYQHLVSTAGNNMFVAPTDYFRLRPTLYGLPTVIVTQHIQLIDGNFVLWFHVSSEHQYELIVTTAGDIELYRNDTLLSSASVAGFNTATVYTLAVSSNNGHITVHLDNMPLINVIDDDPLPQGSVMYQSMLGTFAIDDVVIYSTRKPSTFIPLTSVATLGADSGQSDGVSAGNSVTPPPSAGVGIGESSPLLYLCGVPDDNEFLVTHYCTNEVEGGSQEAFFDRMSMEPPAWSPDGTQIAFADELPNGTNTIIIGTYDGGWTTQQLAYEVPSTIRGMDWSPDGTSLLFVVDNQQLGFMSIIGLPIADCTPTTCQSIVYYQDTLAAHARWSPDGRYISFTGLWEGTARFLVLDTEADRTVDPLNGVYLVASEIELIGSGPLHWSPDGNSLLGWANLPTFENTYLVQIDVETGTSTTIYSGDNNGYPRNPDWSANGTQAVFEFKRFGPGNFSEIHVLNSIGGGATTKVADYGNYPRWWRQQQSDEPIECPIMLSPASVLLNPATTSIPYLQEVDPETSPNSITTHNYANLHDFRKLIFADYVSYLSQGFLYADAVSIASQSSNPIVVNDLISYLTTQNVLSLQTVEFNIDAYFLTDPKMQRSRQLNLVRVIEMVNVTTTQSDEGVIVTGRGDSIALPNGKPFWIFLGGFDSYVVPTYQSGAESAYSARCGGFEQLKFVETLPTRDETIALLGEYGIDVQDGTQTWTSYEVRSIYLGVMRIADAFKLTGQITLDSSVPNTPQQYFKHIYIYAREDIDRKFLRENGQLIEIQLVFLRDAGTESNCRASGGGTGGASRASLMITCRGTIANENMNFNIALGGPTLQYLYSEAVITDFELNYYVPGPEVLGEISQYTVVHELGHLFDYTMPLTPDATQGPWALTFYTEHQIGSQLPDIIVPECFNSLRTVMGLVGNDWARGRRGWGSSNFGQGLSDFQQNPLTDPIQGIQLPLEAAADMYLNWVYRITSDTDLIPLSDPALLCNDVYSIDNDTSNDGSIFNRSSAGLLRPDVYQPDVWEGFRNIQVEPLTFRNPIEAISYDFTLPGNARYGRMIGLMEHLLVNYHP